jgi:hypothetical protein
MTPLKSDTARTVPLVGTLAVALTGAAPLSAAPSTAVPTAVPTFHCLSVYWSPEGKGAGGLGSSSRIIKHCVTRNNILHVRDADSRSISTGKSVDNDFDYDLLSARFPDGQEKHGISGKPTYAPGAGFDFESKTGTFQLTPGSAGYDKAVVIPNFCDIFKGKGPDMGAHETGTAPMSFGVKARFVPPDSARR